MVVRGRDEVHPLIGAPGPGNLLGDLAPGQVAPLSGLCPLADLDLKESRRVEQTDVDPESSRSDLLSAALGVLADHVSDLAALPVEREDSQLLGGFGIGPVGDLSLGAEAHGADDKGVILVEDRDIDPLRRQG